MSALIEDNYAAVTYERHGGQRVAVWTHQPGDVYLVTGRTVQGHRFRSRLTNPYQALAINLHDGRLWLIRHGRRTLLKRVTP